MSLEDQHTDRKSLRKIIGKTANWDEIAKDCVCFANGQGGRLLIGIEDGEILPPSGQTIKHELLDTLRKRIGELTVNVQALPQIMIADNGGQFIALTIPRALGVASTCDGRYFLRVGDTCRPVVGDDVLRLANERPGFSWEAMTQLGVPRTAVDTAKLDAFVTGIRASSRVKGSVKEKTADELLTHYGLAGGATLTNLGVLLLGRALDRSRLGTAPIVQFIKYDERSQKVNKLPWDDYALSPVELVSAIWQEVPDFRESYEIAEGLYRRNVPAFDEKVVRELLVNALVHRPYTQRGDIFLNLHPDRLEVVNPGRLPLGVTPQNILHASIRRNDALARVFHDLGLMEREGSGFDMMYERQLAYGRPAPTLTEGQDSVHVTVRRHILKPPVIRLIETVDKQLQLTQRERIALGLLALSEEMTARELAKCLELPETGNLDAWLGRLPDWGIVQTSGRTQGTRYFVTPALLHDADLTQLTTLTRIEPHRLSELVREDLRRYPDSKMGDVHKRIGKEIKRSQLKKVMAELVHTGTVVMQGERNGARYRLA
ncbi:MAG: putative DNA binding domain-containing protein [Candidatus Competibacteraceae bacterium]|nr:putative DNA binding domain-containing protein [Candidatus Competibacteraceae bacterium]